ncbi:hypothetical protein D7Y54_16400 [Stenotrophomonas maltophilia]|nr:hypothetical protein [Stenotrophomonas maltophilia]
MNEAACRAHARRKYFELHANTGSPQSLLALEHIAGLSAAIERALRGQPPDERRRIRQQRVAPRLRALKRWMNQALVAISYKSDLGKTVLYSAKLGGADMLRRQWSHRDRQLQRLSVACAASLWGATTICWRDRRRVASAPLPCPARSEPPSSTAWILRGSRETCSSASPTPSPH